MSRLKTYIQEGNRHKEHIIEAKEELSLPIESYENLSKLERFALNTLIFRFSKLQDLLGNKIFRNFLEYNELSTQDLSFFDILKAIEKQNILDIDSWSLLRELRNDVAHDYPEELDEMIEKINLFVDKSSKLIEIFDNLEEQYREIKHKRD